MVTNRTARACFFRSSYVRLITVVLTILSSLSKTSCQPIKTQRYVVSTLGKEVCPSFLESGNVHVARSIIECATKCSNSAGCLHYSYYSNNGSCFLYTSTPFNYTTKLADCVFMVNPDAFQGCPPSASVPTDQGICNFPFHYENQEYFQCSLLSGSSPQCNTSSALLGTCTTAPPGFSLQEGITNVHLNGTSVPLPCVNNWIILMQRVDGSLDFYKNWTNYKFGFQNENRSEFWIGNENIYLYTNRPGFTYTLRIEVQTWTHGLWFYADYATFVVDSEANFYKIHVTGFNGNAGDSLSNTTISTVWNHNGMKFSTMDVDNDHSSYSHPCCDYYDNGWWYNGCWYCCLTCVYGTTYLSWYTLSDNGVEPQGQLRAARMMIRSV